MAKPVILNELISSLGLKAYKFEQEIKAANGAVSKILDSQKDISDNLIEKILKRYPQVSRTWLETGEGEMFIERKGPANDDPEKRKKLAEEAIRKAADAKARKLPNDLLAEAYSPTEIGVMFLLGVSHQNSLLEETNIEALAKTVNQRVRLVLKEVVALKQAYKEYLEELSFEQAP